MHLTAEAIDAFPKMSTIMEVRPAGFNLYLIDIPKKMSPAQSRINILAVGHTKGIPEASNCSERFQIILSGCVRDTYLSKGLSYLVQNGFLFCTLLFEATWPFGYMLPAMLLMFFAAA